MNHAVVFYNPYLPELKITVNGKKLSSFSSLMSFQHQRLEKWADCLFSELYREINSEYEVTCISNEFTCFWLKSLAEKNPHCVSFSSQELPIRKGIYDRLEELENLGGEELSRPVIIPVLNASDNSAMISEVIEILEEQCMDSSEESLLSLEYPLVTVELKPEEDGGNAPAVIALSLDEEDYIKANTDAPVFVLVMGAETRFLERRGSKIYFRVDPDDLGSILLGIIEEQVLCPVLSDLSYNLPEDAKSFLTSKEKEKLELICLAAPICRAKLPEICDVGRSCRVEAECIPSDASAEIRLVSESEEIMETDGDMLIPRSEGTCAILIFAGDDPYPIVNGRVKVRERSLIKEINLFPANLYMPVGGREKLNLTIFPPDAENRDEILWKTSNPQIASADPVTGVISGISPGRCEITAYTREAEKTVNVEVQPAIEEIECPCSYMEITAGEQKEWKYSVIPENAYGADLLKISSTDKTVAEYRGGYVLANSDGQCRIYIKGPDNSVYKELIVSVKKRRFW